LTDTIIKMNITERELLDLLVQSSQKREDDVFTCRELAKLSGLSDDSVRRNLAPLIESRKVGCRKVYRMAIDGIERVVPGYYIIKD
jgi:hypothetical protein